MRLRLIGAMLAALAGAPAFAAGSASAQVQDIWGWCGGGGDGGNQCVVSQTVTVTISPDGADVGRPGAFFVGVARNNGSDLAFYQNGQWIPPTAQGSQSNAYAPTEFLMSVPGPRQYVVLTNQMICDMVGVGNTAQLYAGYGVLTAQSEYLVQNYHAAANPRIPADNIRTSYIRQDMSAGKKYWNVLNYDCTNYVPGQGSQSQGGYGGNGGGGN